MKRVSFSPIKLLSPNPLQSQEEINKTVTRNHCHFDELKLAIKRNNAQSIKHMMINPHVAIKFREKMLKIKTNSKAYQPMPLKT